MTTTQFFSLLLLLATSNLFAQNLVPNHSFEEFVDGCPSTFNGTVALGWQSWAVSPDLFSTCVDPQNFSDSLGWVPWNGFGYQWPADGESYAGLYACGSPGFSQNFREYLGCELLEPLDFGETYYVSFKASMAFGNYYYTVWACNRLGAYFTTQSYDWETNPLEIPNFAHVYEESIIADTTNWVTVSGSFVADEAYTHMGLGVFFEYSLLETLSLMPGASSLGGYYYIDDVCVSRFPDCGVSTSSKMELAEDLVKVYPNPATTHVVVEASYPIVSIGMQDFSGKWVAPSRNINDQRVTWDLMEIPAGVYILDIETATVHKRKKLVVVR